MKKILLSLSMLATVLSAQAQVFETIDFSEFVVGNIGTDVTGNTPGQAGFLTLNGSTSDYQIVNDGGDHGNVLQLTGSSTSTITRSMWKDGLDDTWDFREEGNNIIQIEYDFFTGPATASKNNMRISLYNSDRTKILAGLLVNMDTKAIQGLANFAPAGGVAGNYSFFLATGGTDVVLQPNTWVKLGMTFNTTTGQVIWKGPGFYGNVMGAAAGTTPFEIRFLASPTYGNPAGVNTVAGIGKFDNLEVQAVPVEQLLAVKENVAVVNTFTVYPNPANNVINVSNTLNNNVNKITIGDLNGRIVKEVKFDNVPNVQINVSDLSSGVYMMNISTDKGSLVKKIIKN